MMGSMGDNGKLKTRPCHTSGQMRTLNETSESSSAMVGVRMSTCQRVGMDWLQVGHPPVQQEALRGITL